MSEQLLYLFFSDDRVRLDEESKDDEPKLLWKVVLRTGTWKLRPGPGGVKLKEPLKIFRDKAPKGHISMASLVKNFDAGAKEYVTIPMVHADGTVSDGGFVRKLVIQDVMGEDGSESKESLLWAGMEITDSELQRKLSEKSIRGVSGGVLFNYERTEDAKKFDQILSHVMVTNSPWIGGTGDFKDKLPEGVMASEPEDLPFGELELEAEEPIPLQTEQPGESDPAKAPQPPPGTVVWKPTEGFSYIKSRIEHSLREQRRLLMQRIGDDFYKLDYPRYSVDDVTGDGKTGKALICSGYGPDKVSWVAGYSIEDTPDDHDLAVIDAFQNWTPAKPEWVAASEPDPAPSAAPTPPAPSCLPSDRGGDTTSELRRAQLSRAKRLGLSQTTTTTIGGTRVGTVTDLLRAKGVELSDEELETIRREEEEAERLRRDAEQRAVTDRETNATAYLESLKDTPFDNPGTKKVIQGLLLSDDGGPAVEYVELSETGQRTQPKPMTATEIVKAIVDSVPKNDSATLSSQAPRLPGDAPPPENNPNDESDPPSPEEAGKRADALLAELENEGFVVGGVTGSGS